jgi:Mce-associated membrane protein
MRIAVLWQRRPSRWIVQIVILSVLLLLLLAVSGVLLWHDPVGKAKIQEEAVVNAARVVALELSSIGANNASQRIDSLAKQSTGEFHDQLSGYAVMFEKVLQAGAVTSQVNITSAGIERLDENKATVLLTVTAIVSNSQVPNGEPRGYRLAVELERAGDQWLVSKVNYVA